MATPIELPEHIKPGAYVRVAEWVGKIEDVAIGQKHIMVLVSSPKQVYRHAPSEWLEYHQNNQDLILPASRSDYLAECGRYLSRIGRDRDTLTSLLD